ncbi:ATP-binding cassette domain-containing protein [Enterococcus hirae]|uniref:ABC transporter domain-containing protein n=3 Tax=Enterococcus hirae TaxID=1354 RepID=A0AB37IK19_ENTHR|nr:ABC transporter ATP-binding protein [Enterococcus hirae]EMF0150475.1 ATP-binding cassette domain-containing protein [Enterococcus hirae]EMF0384102.1 ATP-binding cassette domain-containing protein [Enterococcus hirae]EMF0486103.1 ATP-binding cassette domain-containing protein [Enterococcus hirae]EMF0531564.1 ATP-binding cassette domain-containing protein [Enterococcus hirae]PCE08961.1 macrolide ABC transporter ATP-binding protein/permease [Enterococcus hirae]
MIYLNNVSKKYKDLDILLHANYRFKDGTLTCVLGNSGAGKSTLLNLIAGLDIDYDGEIENLCFKEKNFSNKNLSNYRFNNVGFIFQDYHLLNGYTVLENVIMGAHLDSELTKEEKIEKALNLLTELGLKNKANQMVHELSGGQKQRVSIARALMNDPKIILADEPTAALDELNSDGVMKILKRLARNRTVIVITHSEKVSKYADEIVCLKNHTIEIVKEKERYELDYSKESQTFTAKKAKEIVPKLNSKLLFWIAIRNFRIHFLKNLLAIVLISLGTVSFISTLGIKNTIKNEIQSFKEKNDYYSKGSIAFSKKPLSEGLTYLQTLPNVKDVYYQYNLQNINLKYDHKNKHLDTKSPTFISSDLSMIYGDMPKDNRNEISLSLSVASSLSKNINQLVGKHVDFEYFDKEGQKHKIKMKVSGISNDTFDNFTMSTKLEKKIYKEVAKGEASAIAFSVKNFEDIPKIHRLLKSKGYDIYTKEKDIRAFKNSFADTIKLFTILSNLLLLLFISVSFIIIYRISITRYSEVGILSCLGYSTRNISKILRRETVLFCLLSILFSSIWLLIFNTVYSHNFGYNLEFNFQLGLLLLLVNIGLVFGITGFVNYRLVNLSPSLALKK